MFDYKGFRKANKLTQQDLANILGVSRGLVSQWEIGIGGPTEEQIEALLKNASLNTAMIIASPTISSKISGENTTNVSIDYGKAPRKTSSKVASKKTNEIPIFPIEALAGAMQEYADAVMPYQCEMIQSPIASATCAIRVYGDSMVGKYPSGSIALLRKIDPTLYIEYGKTYVLNTDNGAVIKQIEEGNSDGMIKCVSLNPSYKPFEIPMDRILGWYRVLGAVIFD